MIALRVLHQSRVVREAVFSLLPVTIGRAPGNAVRLTDPCVSRAHARIERGEDGRARIVDLGSRNGLRVGGRTVESSALEGPFVVRMGQTDVEIESIPDTPTLEIPAAVWQPRERRCGARACLVSLAVGVAGVLTAALLETSFWSPWNHTRSVGLVRAAIISALALPLLAGVLFLVLKVIGRRVRMADTMRALARTVWLVPALSMVSLAAYYPLSPSQLDLLEGVLSTGVLAVSLAGLASVRREPRSLAFTAGWAGAVFLGILGLATVAALNSRQTGEPSVDLNLQPPVAGYAGRAESFDEYLRAVRAAVRPSEDGGEPATRSGHSTADSAEPSTGPARDEP
jgi:hypothetical protein